MSTDAPFPRQHIDVYSIPFEHAIAAFREACAAAGLIVLDPSDEDPDADEQPSDDALDEVHPVSWG